MWQDLTPLERERAEVSLITIANANEMFVQILKKIMGNEISDSMGDSPVTTGELLLLAQARFDSALEEMPVLDTAS